VSGRPDRPWPDPGAAERPWAIRRLQSLSRRTRLAIGITTVGIIVVAGVIDGLTRTPAFTPQVSDQGPAHAFSLPSVRQPNQTVSLAMDKGHPVILNFWGSWCPPCQKEMPLLAATARAHPGIRFLGVDLEDPQRSAAVAMMNRYGTPYPSGYDPNDTLAGRYGLQGTPTTFFIDARGHIVGQAQGQLDAAVLDFWIRYFTPTGS
jgi:cytochrome c biogenesis protein CcmG/thiol:disulfide interchange protein DsbE